MLPASLEYPASWEPREAKEDICSIGAVFLNVRLAGSIVMSRTNADAAGQFVFKTRLAGSIVASRIIVALAGQLSSIPC